MLEAVSIKIATKLLGKFDLEKSDWAKRGNIRPDNSNFHQPLNEFSHPVMLESLC